MAAIDLRYARALAAVVSDQNLDPADTQKQLDDFASTLAASAELREVLEDPSIPEAQKLGVMDAIADRSGMSMTVRNFIAVIVKHQRLQEFDAMVAANSVVSDAEARVAEAEITTAHPLDDRNKTLLEQQVAKLAGGDRVRATYREDAALLGGAVVKIGSTVYDGSVRAQLEQLKVRLMAAGT